MCSPKVRKGALVGRWNSITTYISFCIWNPADRMKNRNGDQPQWLFPAMLAREPKGWTPSKDRIHRILLIVLIFSCVIKQQSGPHIPLRRGHAMTPSRWSQLSFRALLRSVAQVFPDVALKSDGVVPWRSTEGVSKISWPSKEDQPLSGYSRYVKKIKSRMCGDYHNL